MLTSSWFYVLGFSLGNGGGGGGQWILVLFNFLLSLVNNKNLKFWMSLNKWCILVKFDVIKAIIKFDIYFLKSGCNKVLILMFQAWSSKKSLNNMFCFQDSLPPYPLSGMLNKSGGKVRLTFKLEVDQVWIGTKGLF